MSGVIYGYIQSWAHGVDDEVLHMHNAKVLSTLPLTASYICREMFSQLPHNHAAICKNGQLIHFGAATDMYEMDPDWVEEFEKLLRQLWWSQAAAIETYSGNRFEWFAQRSDDGRTITPVTNWNRKAFATYHYLEEVPFNENGF